MTVSRIAARAIMADLRNRNEMHKILAPTNPNDGTPWATPDMQQRIEDRIAEIVDAHFEPAP